MKTEPTTPESVSDAIEGLNLDGKAPDCARATLLRRGRTCARRVQELEAENKELKIQECGFQRESIYLEGQYEYSQHQLKEQLASAERTIVNIRRAGRVSGGNYDKVIDMRSIACRIEIDEEKYPKEQTNDD